MWGKRMVIQMGLVALFVLAGAVAIFLSRRDVIDPAALWLIAALTWPWVFVMGAAVGHLWPHQFFADDRQD
jgi:hypothetical protein